MGGGGFLESGVQTVNVMTFALDQTFPKRNILQRQNKNTLKKHLFSDLLRPTARSGI